jgi:hypothetical protein
LLGTRAETRLFVAALDDDGRRPVHVEWNWGQDVPADRVDLLVVCKVPTEGHHWTAMRQLRQSVSVPVLGISELLLPFAPLVFAQSVLRYFEETASLSTAVPYYLGRSFFGPIEELDAVFPLAGRSVIEFGPMDGCQTAALVTLGADRIVAIEARAENYLKTLIARETFGWPNVTLVMDDFHNTHETTYGRFDLVFAHGVYYHSIAPFHFLTNMTSLADAVYLGGFCATDALPSSPWLQLSHNGRQYRAKRYEESTSMTAGINAVGFFFSPEDLTRWFEDQGWSVTVLSDGPSEVAAGRYVRLLARRTS